MLNFAGAMVSSKGIAISTSALVAALGILAEVAAVARSTAFVYIIASLGICVEPVARVARALWTQWGFAADVSTAAISRATVGFTVAAFVGVVRAVQMHVADA